jgi:hypothetical protein
MVPVTSEIVETGPKLLLSKGDAALAYPSTPPPLPMLSSPPSIFVPHLQFGIAVEVFMVNTGFYRT